jgi:hypothetical protein
MLTFVGSTFGIDMGIAILASFRNDSGAAQLQGFRVACITALVMYVLSLPLPTWLSYNSRHDGPARKAAIPPLHARGHISLHSMVLTTPALNPDAIALLASSSDDRDEIRSSEML